MDFIIGSSEKKSVFLFQTLENRISLLKTGMATITDFQGWLDSVPLDDHDDVYSLYHSVSKCEELGMFKTQLAKGAVERWIVSCDSSDDSLLLASQIAKETFLNHLEKSYCGDLEIEGWYAYKTAMAKND